MLKSILIAMIFLGSTTFVSAQQKPDAPPINDTYETAPDIERFVEAYQRAGEPAILVLTGVDNRPNAIRYGNNTDDLRAEGRAATGIPNTQEHYIGNHLALFDPSGDSTKLRGDIEEVLLQNLDIDLVNIDALAERDRREIRLLQQRDEQGAIALLAEKLNAEVVLLVRMLNTPAVENRGALYRVTVEVLDVPRGRKIGGFTFDWTQGADGVMVKRYGQQIARKFIEQFSAWYARGNDESAARRYTIRVIGLGDVKQLVEAKRAFAKIPGVIRVKERGFTTDGETSVGTLDLRTTGTPLELMVDLQDAARDTLGLEIDATDGASGTITLIAPTEKQSDPSERWLAIIDKDDPDHDEVVALLMKEYADEGRPKIGILVTIVPNQSPADEGSGSEGNSGSGVSNVDNDGLSIITNVIIPGGGEAVVSYPENPLLDQRRMEDAMYKWMLDLALTMVDPASVRQSIETIVDDDQANEDIPKGDRFLSRLVQAAGLDILITGVGRDEDGQADYTFRAVRVNDGVALAAEGVSDDYWFRRNEQATINLMAAYATGHLLDQMLTAWTPASTIAVTVTGADAQRDVFTMMNALNNNIAAVESADFERHEAGADGGVGYFTLRYRGGYEALVEAINEQAEALPFDLAADGTTRDTLTLRISDEL